MKLPEYWELVDVLAGMASQYLEDENGEINDDAVSAGEDVVDVLSRLGLMEDNKLSRDAFNVPWLRKRFCEGATPDWRRHVIGAEPRDTGWVMNFEDWWTENASKPIPRPRKEAIRALWETAARSEREVCAKICRAKKPRGNASDDLAAKLLEEAAREIESRGVCVLHQDEA